MKITFLIPPVLDNTKDVDRCFGCNYCIYFLPLLPVLYMASVLKNTGDSIFIFDFAATKKSKRNFENFLIKDNSDIYVFYTVFLSQNTDLIARKIIRDINPQAKFIFSGPQATFYPEVFLDNSDTYALRGEPEFIIRELISALKKGQSPEKTNGVSFYRDSGITHNPSAPLIADIDQIPIPDRTLLDHVPYCNPKLRSVPHTAILTSRGCSGQCWFCVPNSLSYARELEHKKKFNKKPPVRLHSVERVVEEFSSIAKQGFKSVSIIDDQFIWGNQRTIAICQGIKGLGLEWSCLCRPENINQEVAKSMKAAGCAYVDLGTESFDKEVLQAVRKDMSPQDTRKAVEILKTNNIEVEINIILGATPKETEATIRKTLKELKKIDADYVLFSIANPFPGTDFYNAAKKEGWLFYGDYVPVDSAKDAIISYPHLSKQRLEYLCSYAYLSYYFNPRYLLRQLFNLKSFSDLRNKLATLVRFLIKNFLKK